MKRRRLFDLEKKKRVQRRLFHLKSGGDNQYGISAEKPDISTEALNILKKNYMSSIQVLRKDELELGTRGQILSEKWRQERSKRISSSYFKEIVTRRHTTRTANLVKRIVYENTTACEAMQYGLANEAKVLAQYEHDKQLYVHRCGLFIDPANPFLCTSPDGLIGDIGLVEVKCPYSARDSTNLKEFFKQNKQQGLKWNANGSFYLPDTHKYYFQIQGQLNITNRSWCDLFYWCQGDTLTVRIEKNEKF
ncbi:uncharacterized protein LOC118185502 [Stegodyphus dumicola]|uniref:uncharacterized protein LOC118185502 n=1 Tax=Stegodyphus dumicola TaxID=202533 RepID=UPI0015A7E00F|nr:uncharacterized protein LOC118185502 [Stegodyphus dumicola]